VSVLCVYVSALTLVGQQKGHLAHTKPVPFVPKVLFWNNWRKKEGGIKQRGTGQCKT